MLTLKSSVVCYRVQNTVCTMELFGTVIHALNAQHYAAVLSAVIAVSYFSSNLAPVNISKLSFRV
jgi:hypothetical protein